jgi:Flp pilus assembly protein TadG
MIRRSKLFCARLGADQRGAMTILMAACAVAFLGFGAIVVDLASVFHAKRSLQASTDAAALAGAQNLSSTGSPTLAVSTATTYSAGSGDKNADPNLSVTATPATVNCTGLTGSTCTATTTNPNGIKVTQSTTVPLYFAPILGIDTASISTTAYALQSGGKAVNTDVVIILDTTASMNNTDSSCSGNTRLNCAFSGIKTMLTGFDGTTQQVALMVFPGLTTAANAALEYDCSSSTPTSSAIAKYNASASAPATTPPVYQIVPFSSDYKANSTTLNTSSNLVIAARGGATGCVAGITAYGGVGTYYADVVTAAQNYLTNYGRAGSNKMIILLSDGDASATSSNMASAKLNNQCHQGITNATTAKASGTTVITIGYGSPGSGSCSTDSSPSITACQTLLNMATVGTGTTAAPEWFYSDTASACTGGHSATNLTSIFTQVGSGIANGGTRLIPSS